MNIGHITSTGKGYKGELKTLTVLRTITIEPNRNSGPKAPHYWVYDAPAREIGYAYIESFEGAEDDAIEAPRVGSGDGRRLRRIYSRSIRIRQVPHSCP